MNKQFWETYISDWGRLICMFIFGILFVGLFALFLGYFPWTFLMGYVLADPFSYYMITYPKELKRLEYLKRKNSLDNPFDGMKKGMKKYENY